MRILVTGSRDWQDARVIGQWLDYYYHQVLEPAHLVVVHGGCPTGADKMADSWARTQGLSIEAHPAQWGVHGRAAGPIRNAHMVQLGADVCLAFIRNGSVGASHTAALAEGAGITTRRFIA